MERWYSLDRSTDAYEESREEIARLREDLPTRKGQYVIERKRYEIIQTRREAGEE